MLGNFLVFYGLFQYLCDLLTSVKDADFASYAEVITPYNIAEDLDRVLLALQNAASSLFKRFLDNHM